MTLLATAIIVAALVGSLAHVRATRRAAGPTRELASAVRLLDRILSYDEAVSALSSELRDEARRLTRTYYKEIEP